MKLAQAVDDPICTITIQTPVGPMLAAAVAEGLCALEFAGGRRVQPELAELERLLSRELSGRVTDQAGERLERIRVELAEYFDGERREFSVPLVMPGGEFEKRVWERLLAIPLGRTKSYGQVAMELGQPGALCAVGRANGRNRIAIVVPCHRVIESTGALRGYGGGLERKKWLLDHERAMVEKTLFD